MGWGEGPESKGERSGRRQRLKICARHVGNCKDFKIGLGPYFESDLTMKGLQLLFPSFAPSLICPSFNRHLTDTYSWPNTAQGARDVCTNKAPCEPLLTRNPKSVTFHRATGPRSGDRVSSGPWGHSFSTLLLAHLPRPTRDCCVPRVFPPFSHHLSEPPAIVCKRICSDTDKPPGRHPDTGTSHLPVLCTTVSCNWGGDEDPMGQ